jgi:hypothetical protein
MVMNRGRRPRVESEWGWKLPIGRALLLTVAMGIIRRLPDFCNENDVQLKTRQIQPSRCL